MTLQIGNITFDCDDPQKVAAFWSAALERPVDEGGSPFFASIGVSDPATLPNWLFLAVPEHKTAKNRLHLDFGSEDRAADVARLVSLGATHVADKDEWGHSWAVLTDVEGNEFCVAQV
ncbi:MAG: VOC family protein [Actinomycetota bacterium]